jgi:hypothetical protein
MLQRAVHGTLMLVADFRRACRWVLLRGVFPVLSVTLRYLSGFLRHGRYTFLLRNESIETGPSSHLGLPGERRHVT